MGQRNQVSSERIGSSPAALPGRSNASLVWLLRSIEGVSMPHVSVHYKIYLTAGHHRQPRNASSTLEPNPPSEVDVAQPGNITPLYIPQLPFMDGTTPALSQLLFWSVTDGVNGQTFPAGQLTQPVGANPLPITAWYFPIGSSTGNGTAIIDDAFSAIAGNF